MSNRSIGLERTRAGGAVDYQCRVLAGEFLVQIPAKVQGQGSQTKRLTSVNVVEVSDSGYFSGMENNCPY